MLTFTALETAVLEAICQSYKEYGARLRDLLADASVTNRENTGHGFYTSISATRLRPPLHDCRHIGGPVAYMVGMGDGMAMAFELWLDDGYPTLLEGYQLGDNSGATIDLKQRDLLSLRFSSIEPR